MISPQILPTAIHEAILGLVKAINTSGERCVGIVVTVVFDGTTRVIPAIDPDVRSTLHENPRYALLETAAAALMNVLEGSHQDSEPKN